MPGLIMETHKDTNGSRPATAPVYDVPQNRVVGVEHPCVVKNFDSAVKSLGGEPQIKHVSTQACERLQHTLTVHQILEHAVGDSSVNLERPLEEPKVGVSLRPHDPFAKKIVSTGIETRNVLVKVTVPKRTGRKRKRGTNDPFVESDGPSSRNESVTAQDLLQRLKDTEGRYSVEAIGTVNETHRFRSMPDFQLKASDHATMRELASHTMKPSYDALKKFHVDLTPGAAHIDSLPAPPNFMTQVQPYRYRYEQAPGVVIEKDATGKATMTNTQAPTRRVVVAVDADVSQVPTGPPPELKRRHPNGTYLVEAVQRLRVLLEERPLVTRRFAMNVIPHYSDTVFKEATEWVGYSFRAGPWANSLIKYGVDPRTDPKYRIYQTMNFQLDKHAYSDKNGAAWNRSVRHIPDGEANHLFDGTSISINGKTWQVCDITDPILAKLFATDNRPTKCDPFQHGWYHNGTLAKARAIMRDKIDCLFKGIEPPHHDYELIAALADNMTHDKMPEAYLGEGASAKAIGLSVQVRSQARSSRQNILDRERELKQREKYRKTQTAVGGKGKERQTDDAGEGAPVNPAIMADQEVEPVPEEDGVDLGEDDEDEDNGLGDDDMDNDFDADVNEEDEDADADLEAAGDLQDEDDAGGETVAEGE